MLDAHFDHSHTCNQHSSTIKDAQEHMFSAFKNIRKRCDLTTMGKYVTSSLGRKKGDLEIRNIILAGKRDMAIDVALVPPLKFEISDGL